MRARGRATALGGARRSAGPPARASHGGNRTNVSHSADLSVGCAAMFQEVLKEVVDGTEGGVATLLMDFEGIAVDSYSKPNATFDITTIGAEFSVVIKSIQRAAQMLEAGNTAEIAIQAEKMITLIRVVNDSYFVAFSMQPDANIGKARYMLRTRVPAILKELS